MLVFVRRLRRRGPSNQNNQGVPNTNEKAYPRNVVVFGQGSQLFVELFHPLAVRLLRDLFARLSLPIPPVFERGPFRFRQFIVVVFMIGYGAMDFIRFCISVLCLITLFTAAPRRLFEIK